VTEEDEAQRDRLVRNERAKLSATYFNGLAVALAAIGGLSPLLSIIVTPGSGPSHWVVVVVAAVCFSGSAALHFTARRFLGGLRP
jgi:hypothetical protein